LDVPLFLPELMQSQRFG